MNPSPWEAQFGGWQQIDAHPFHALFAASLMSVNAEAMIPAGGSCLSGRPPRLPRSSAQSLSSLISMCGRHGIRRPVARGRSRQLSIWADEVGDPGAREPLKMFSRSALDASKRRPDGSDAIAAALMQRRRKNHGGTPSRPDDNGALHLPPRLSLSASAMASCKALQAAARADVLRAVGVKAEAAAAAATLSGSASSLAVQAAVVADERAVSAFLAADAEADRAAGEARTACAAAAAAAAAVEAASVAASTAAEACSATASSAPYFSPVSDFE